MTYIKLLTILAGLALLTACAGGVTNNIGEININNGETCDTNPFGADCGEEFETERQTIAENCRTNGEGEFCAEATTFACTDNFFHELCNGIMEYEDKRTNFNSMCINQAGKTKEICDAEAQVRTCAANPFMDTCVADTGAIALRQSRCLADTTINPACTGTTGIATLFCKDDPFHDSNACKADTGAIALRQSMCLADIDEDPSCDGEMGIATVFCKANLFDTSNACMADTYLPLRIADCIMAGNAGESKCNTVSTDTEKNTMITDCLKNPFATACESVTDFTTYALARTNRASFCDNSLNVTDDLCMGDVVSPICGLDPFNAICFTGDTYLSPRVADCIKTENTGIAKCNTLLSDTDMNTAITDCLEKPFATACESVTAFMSSFADARTNRASFCNDNMNVANTLCMGDTLEAICGLDPFNATCLTDKTYLPMRLTECIKTENTEGNMKCNTLLSDATMNTTITACLANPFSSACEADSDFMTYAETAQTNRGSFCDMAGNDTKALCMGANLMGVCGIDSFNAICFTDKTYLPMRLGECIKTENAEDMRCNTLLSDSTMNTAITACLTNPFTDACTSNTDFMTYAGDARTNRVSFCGMSGNESKAPCTALTTCQTNLFDPTCGAYFEPARILHCMNNNDVADCPNVTYGDWTASFTSPALATAPVNRGGSIEYRFLSGLTKTQPTITGFTTASYASVTLADHNLGGDPDAGFAIWFGNWDGNVNNYYSGILTTTNVGTPLNNAKQGGTWNGRIRAFNSADINLLNRNFTLTVNFGNKEINAFFANIGSSNFYEIEGSFEGGLLLSGSVEFGQDTSGAMGGGGNGALESGDGLYVSGTLTGLIGADGAVGVFIGKRDDISFSGGFVAVPPPPPMPNHATFKTYYADSARANNRRLLATPTTTTATAAFVEGTATSLPTDGLTFTGTNRFAPITVRLGEAVSGDDGFAIMYGVTTDGSNGIYRAGLLSMTDLGPAVPTTGMATWSGTIYSSINLTSGVPASIPLDLTVNFTDGEINTTTPATHGTSTITVKGRFGSAHGLDDGILGGTVDYNVANSLQAPALPLIGLIGTEGVIGVFHGDGKLTAVGGFQASPN